MIIRSKAPLRLGIAGGGTDVSPYCDLYGGLVLNVTINLYAYCTIEETNDGRIEIHSWDTGVHESISSSSHLDIDGKASLIKGVYNHVVDKYSLPPLSMRITTYNDAPIGSGLGTSSTMVVCILKAFSEWKNLPLDKNELAQTAYVIERHELGLKGGKQDQFAASFGGFNFIEFQANNLVTVNPLKIERWIKDELEASMLLFYTGRSRVSAHIINEQQDNVRNGKQKAIEAMHRIKQDAIDIKGALLEGDINRMAGIIRQSWTNKQLMASNISNSTIQEVMHIAREAGAKAGKVSGAGGGGFIIFIVDPVRKKELEMAVSTLGGHVVHFNFSEGGAQSWRIHSTDSVNKK